MNRMIATVIAGLLAAPVLAESHATGDAEAGGEQFNRQCVTCHVIVDDNGETLAGRKAKTGPNLYKVIGRAAGTVEDFRYGDSIVEAGEAGLTWDVESMAAYLQDPKAYLAEVLDDSKARSKMAFKVRKEEAVNIAAYLASFSEAATN